MEMPEAIRRTFGYALRFAQRGERHASTKVLSGFGGAGVLEVIEDDRAGTYRCVYTVKFKGMVYVLHVFQKKSKSGIAHPKKDEDTIRRNLREAEEDYQERIKRGEIAP